jgi:hypothetical protein
MYKNSRPFESTSFHDVTITATLRQMFAALGEFESGGDKTTYEWEMRTSKGNKLFTVYDWKDYISSDTQRVTWHIGGKCKEDTEQAKIEILEALSKLPKDLPPVQLAGRFMEDEEEFDEEY